MTNRNFPLKRALGACAFATLLAACGGGGGSEPEHEHTRIDTAGRLALSEDAGNVLRMYELDDARVASTFALANPPSAVYASPGGRYALAVQRTQDLVQAVDGGVYQEDHGDHLHDYKETPRLLAWQLTGPQPTHYDDRAGQAVFFMDGRATATPVQPSSAVLLTDASIGRGETVARVGFASAMHGFAEPNGQRLVASWRDPAGTGTSPTQVEVYRRNGSGYSFEQRLDARCNGMHGSYTLGSATVAGCSDGVLVAAPQGAGFAATLVATPTGISTVAGHPKQARMVGIGNAGTPSTTRFYDIDAGARTASAIGLPGWAEGRLRRAHGFDRSGRYFFVLDDLGTLHVLERGASGWSTTKTLAGAVPAMPAAAPFPAFAANGARDEIYLTDPQARQLVVVDSSALAVKQRRALDFKPSYAAWVGIAR